MIPRQTVDEILSKTDIVALVGQRVTLKRAGQVFKGLCPFHAEKTPSFTVSPKRGSFHCFGCGASGDAFAFLMQSDGVSFREAALELGAQAGVEVQEAHGEDAGEVGRMAGLRRRYFDLLARAAKLWQGALWGAQGAKARAYLEARGVSPEEARRWGLGYAPLGLVAKMDAAGVSREDQVLSGLVSVDEDGRVGERFRGRLVFPVKDAWGRILGFSGRTLDDVGEDGQPLGGEVKTYGPKYVNSPETPWYKKGDVLLGLDLARDLIRANGEALLVEGNFDAVAAQRAGLGAVAPCGTALTPQQARALARVTDAVTVAFDGDKAGRAAAVKSVEILRAAGLRVKVASLPEGQDPATMDGRDLGGLVGVAVSGMQFVLEQRIHHALTGDVETRVAAKEAALEVVAQEPEENLRRFYADWVAQRLRLQVVTPRFDPKAQKALDEAQEREQAEARKAAAARPFDGVEARLVRMLAQSSLWHVEFVEAGLVPTLQDEALVLFIEVAGQMGGRSAAWARAARWVEQEMEREGLAAQLAAIAARAEDKPLDGEAFVGAAKILVGRYLVAQRRMVRDVPPAMLRDAIDAYAALEIQTMEALEWVTEPWMEGAVPTPKQEADACAKMPALFGELREELRPVAVGAPVAVIAPVAVVEHVAVVEQVAPAVPVVAPVVAEVVPVVVPEQAEGVALVVDVRPAPSMEVGGGAGEGQRRGMVQGAGAGVVALGAPHAAPPSVGLAQGGLGPASWRIVEGGKGRDAERAAARGADLAPGVRVREGGGHGAESARVVGWDDGWDAVPHDAPKAARAGP